MSERGSFVTQPMYCYKCLGATIFWVVYLSSYKGRELCWSNKMYFVSKKIADEFITKTKERFPELDISEPKHLKFDSCEDALNQVTRFQELTKEFR